MNEQIVVIKNTYDNEIMFVLKVTNYDRKFEDTLNDTRTIYEERRENEIMFMTDANKITGFKVLKYKHIVFDEWTEDEHGIWAEICEHCLKKYEGRMDLELDSAGGVGACSVRDCNTVGMDDDVEMTYIDFDINGVEIIEESLEELIGKLKERDMTLNGIEEELTYRDNAAEGARWDDVLYEYTTEELEVLERRWNDFA